MDAGIHTEIASLMKHKGRDLWSFIRRQDTVPEKRVAQLLANWGAAANETGGAGKEEEKADSSPLMRPRKRRRLRVLNEDLTTHDLREILQACLKDLPQESPKAGRGFLRMASGRWANLGHAAVPTEDELDKAALFLIKRFGEVEKAESDENKAEKPENADSTTARDKEFSELAATVAQLASMQRELAEGQQRLLHGQKILAREQSSKFGQRLEREANSEAASLDLLHQGLLHPQLGSQHALATPQPGQVASPPSPRSRPRQEPVARVPQPGLPTHLQGLSSQQGPEGPQPGSPHPQQGPSSQQGLKGSQPGSSSPYSGLNPQEASRLRRPGAPGPQQSSLSPLRGTDPGPAGLFLKTQSPRGSEPVRPMGSSEPSLARHGGTPTPAGGKRRPEQRPRATSPGHQGGRRDQDPTG
eukprot:jgi/Botrbrau1/10598/Bobra.0358s0017.1